MVGGLLCCGRPTFESLSMESLVDEKTGSIYVGRVRDPPIDLNPRPLDYVATLAELHEQLETALPGLRSELYFEQSLIFRGLGEDKLVRQSLAYARSMSPCPHLRLVHEAILMYECREEVLDDEDEEFGYHADGNGASNCTGVRNEEGRSDMSGAQSDVPGSRSGHDRDGDSPGSRTWSASCSEEWQNNRGFDRDAYNGTKGPGRGDGSTWASLELGKGSRPWFPWDDLTPHSSGEVTSCWSRGQWQGAESDSAGGKADMGTVVESQQRLDEAEVHAHAREGMIGGPHSGHSEGLMMEIPDRARGFCHLAELRQCSCCSLSGSPHGRQVPDCMTCVTWRLSEMLQPTTPGRTLGSEEFGWSGQSTRNEVDVTRNQHRGKALSTKGEACLTSRSTSGACSSEDVSFSSFTQGCWEEGAAGWSPESMVTDGGTSLNYEDVPPCICRSEEAKSSSDEAAPVECDACTMHPLCLHDCSGNFDSIRSNKNHAARESLTEDRKLGSEAPVCSPPICSATWATASVPPCSCSPATNAREIGEGADIANGGAGEVVQEEGPQTSGVEKVGTDEILFRVGSETVRCSRAATAKLSHPLAAMLNGAFLESSQAEIDFTATGISLQGMRAVECFSREGWGRLGEPSSCSWPSYSSSFGDQQLPTCPVPTPSLLLEVLGFANRFCCEQLKRACELRLAEFAVSSVGAALRLMDWAIGEQASVLAGACLWKVLCDMPQSLENPAVISLLATPDGAARLNDVGQSSFALFFHVAHVAWQEEQDAEEAAGWPLHVPPPSGSGVGANGREDGNKQSNSIHMADSMTQKEAEDSLVVALLHRALEAAKSARQRAVALHQLGCTYLVYGQLTAALECFRGAVHEGHAYSRVGIARIYRSRQLAEAAAQELTDLITSAPRPLGWMFQERALALLGSSRLADLYQATDLDPTLPLPYMMRAAMLMDDNKPMAAINEINRILGFHVSAELLEQRTYLALAMQDYPAAVRDLRALLTLSPNFRLYYGRVSAQQLLRLLAARHVAPPRSLADCWLRLFDSWSALDDVASLATVHHMLELDPGPKGLLYFRQSLLLLRLSCPRAATRALRQARNSPGTSLQERIVYEGWILYDTGRRASALARAEKSISLQRTFEAYFLKAYALADTSLDENAGAKVIALLEEALKCPSDGLRKGQALNNLGSVHVDMGNNRAAAECYLAALCIRHTRAHQGLARVYSLEGKRQMAYDEMTRLIQKARGAGSAYEKRSEYCAARELAITDLAMVTHLDPLRTYPYRYRAAVLMDNHKETEALAELSRAMAFKADLQLLHLRAAFHECMGNHDLAIRDCRAALSIDPHHAETLELLRTRLQEHVRVYGLSRS